MRRLIALFVLASLFAACSSPAAQTSVPTAAVPSVTYNGPAWTRIAFTDVRTNKPIHLADFAGKTVYVEAMATWCTNCKAQQREVVEARKSFKDDVVFLSLSVEPNDDVPKLVQYIADQGFDWNFGLSNQELSTKLIEAFGTTVINPTAMPLFIISPTGKVTDLLSGGHRADDLVKLIKQQQSAT